MTDLLCVHRWEEWSDEIPEIARLPDFKDKPYRIRHCYGICGVWWKSIDPEPEVVIARLRDA